MLWFTTAQLASLFYDLGLRQWIHDALPLTFADAEPLPYQGSKGVGALTQRHSPGLRIAIMAASHRRGAFF